ncbi:MAG: halocyanin domain-containing protein [Halorientalis sp.]
MVAAPSDVSDFLSDADNFDGKMANETGEDSVQIKVGVGENGYAFDPAAVKVSKGTKITWVWTGKGGSHNVDAQSGADFKSDLQSSAGSKFSYTADSTGTITYWCQPHHTLGMKGAIVVE